MKAHRYKRLPSGGYPVDKYPEIDQYIPEAVAEADRAVNGIEKPNEWNRVYLAAMNRILVEKGLRVP